MIQLETMRLEFIKPIVIGQGEGAITYTHVDLREPEASDLENGQRADTPVGMVINMVSSVGKVPRLVAEKMKGRDIDRASRFFSGFQHGPEAAADGQS